MNVQVIAYFEDSAITLSYSQAKVVTPIPLKIKIKISDEETHIFVIEKIIKVETKVAGRKKFFHYEIAIVDAGIIRRKLLRYYPEEILWELMDD